MEVLRKLEYGQGSILINSETKEQFMFTPMRDGRMCRYNYQTYGPAKYKVMKDSEEAIKDAKELGIDIHKAMTDVTLENGKVVQKLIEQSI